MVRSDTGNDRMLHDGISGQFLLEKRLKELDPGLHQCFTDTVFALQEILFRFRRIFPEFTDHSALHSINVIDFCNRLIGPDQTARLDADSIYVLLTACYLHDVGMGISMEQYREFTEQIPKGDYIQTHPDASAAEIIRDFHQEFSACFIRKYVRLFDIPSPEHAFVIVQVCRGHRRTDLFDRSQFPERWMLPDGNQICLPYLAAVIRLADEIDVAADRNPALLYDMESLSTELEIAFHKRHRAVRDVVVTKDAFLVNVLPCEPEIQTMIENMIRKMQKTLDTCRAAVDSCPFEITQRRVLLIPDQGGGGSWRDTAADSRRKSPEGMTKRAGWRERDKT